MQTEIGDLLWRNNQYEPAIERLESSLSFYPPGHISPWLYNLIGTLAFDTGQFDKAKWAFEKALAIEPNLPEAPRYLDQIKEKGE